MQSQLAERIEAVRERMARACARSGRSAGAVRLLAATKNVGPGTIREAYGCGLRLLGENRVQERQSKRGELADLEAEWHLLGPLQSNKAARAIEMFDVIESLDSLALAERLNRLLFDRHSEPHTLAVMLEINVGAEAQKHGIGPATAVELAQAIAKLRQLRLCGVMAVPPFAEVAEHSRRYFAALAELGERVRQAAGVARDGWELSMGMSHDFEVAIEEGATLVRVGTAIFGLRPPPPSRA